MSEFDLVVDKKYVKRLATATVAAGAFVACMAAISDRHKQSFMISGADTRPCADWISVRGKLATQPGCHRRRIDDGELDTGLMNGMKIRRIGDGLLAVEPPDAPVIREFIDRYCKDKPASSILNASIQLYLFTEPKPGR